MLRNNATENKNRQPDDSSSKAINLVGSTTTIKGEVHTESDIRIDGRIEGDLHTQTKVVLGESGVVQGHVYCESADISGRITGNIYCKELLKLQASAKIDGDISTKRMVVEKGAMFNGQCTMQEQVAFPQQPTSKGKHQAPENSSSKQPLDKAQSK